MTTVSPILPSAAAILPAAAAILPAAAPGLPAAGAPGAGPGTPDRARLHQAAQAFEAIFVRQMLAAARQSDFGDSLWGSDQGQGTFAGMRDERLADLTAQSGTLGLAQQIERQLAPKIDATPADAPKTGSETRR